MVVEDELVALVVVPPVIGGVDEEAAEEAALTTEVALEAVVVRALWARIWVEKVKKRKPTRSMRKDERRDGMVAAALRTSEQDV